MSETSAGGLIAALQKAAKADPEAFFGSRVRGMDDGLTRVKAML